MELEEAIRHCREVAKSSSCIECAKEHEQLARWLEELKALKEQASGDCISRKAALYGLASIAKAKAKSDAQKSLMGRVMFFIEQLSPVTPQTKEEPQPKIGRWEYVQYDANPNIGNWHCSECRYIIGGGINKDLTKFNYCPNCGSYNGGEK